MSKFIPEDDDAETTSPGWLPLVKGVSPSEAVAYLRGSVAHLARHAQSPAVRYEIRALEQGPRRVHLQVWWLEVPSPVANELIWDTVDVRLPTSLEMLDFYRSLEAAGLVINIEAEVGLGVIARKAPTRGFRYHPIRFRSHHPLGKPMAQHGRDSVDSAFTMEGMQLGMQALMAAQDPAAFRVRERVLVPDQREAISGTASLGLFYADYIRAGGAIYDMPEGLVERFRHTNVDDLPLSMLTMPYETIYLYFGRQHDLGWHRDWVLDGAYVAALGEGKMQVALTCAPPDVQAYHNACHGYEPKFIVAFDEKLSKLTAGLAVDEVIAAKTAELRKQIAGDTEFARAFEEAAGPTGDGLPGTIRNDEARNAERELALLPKKREALIGALKLVINSIAYLTAYPEDTDEQWSEGAPPALLERLSSVKPKIRKKARSELLQHGHTLVKLAGRTFRREYGGVGGSERGPGAATWVQGHWFHQAYGPRWSLNRWRLRMAYKRNAEMGTPVRSHIYMVDEHDATARPADEADRESATDSGDDTP